MKNEQIINNLCKLYSIKKMSRDNYRLHESETYVSDGFVILLKSYEPNYWKNFRYNLKLNDEQTEKLMSKAKESNNELTLNDGIWLKHPDCFKLFCDKHDTYVNPSYLVLLKNVRFTAGGLINFDVLKFKQADSPIDPVFLEHAGIIIGAIMPKRCPEN